MVSIDTATENPIPSRTETPKPIRLPRRIWSIVAGSKVRRALLDRIEYAVFRTVVALLWMMPLELATQIGAIGVAQLAPRLSRVRHLEALANLRTAFPEKSEVERQAICRRHWANLGRVAVETVQIERILNDPSRVEVANPDLMRRYRNKFGPVIGASLHMGNWELAIWPFHLAGAEASALYRAMRNPLIDDYLRSKRAKLYPGGLYGRGFADGEKVDERGTVRRFTDLVRRNGQLGVVSDRFYWQGIEVDFFGHPTRAQPIAGLIARRIGARLWVARCLRIGTTSRFRIELKEIKVPRGPHPSEDLRTIAQDIHHHFEDWIREAPDQWMWFGRKWYFWTLPNGECVPSRRSKRLIKQ